VPGLTGERLVTVDIRGIPTETALRARVTREVTGLLGRLRVSPVTARATFFDENGPKGGPAFRSALTVRVPYQPTIRVEHLAETPRLAFDGVLPALERELRDYVRRARDERRHPKKYYAARRARERA
jgi:ribosome-associated translation inhibitor RaiA